MYIDSKKLNMYPSAFRGQVEVTVGGTLSSYVLDPESRLNAMENNITRPFVAVADYNRGSFVISDNYSSNSDFEFVIHGYYFKLRQANLGTTYPVYAHIAVADKGLGSDSDTDNIYFKGETLINLQEANSTYLDVGGKFQGLLINNSPDDASSNLSYNYYNLQLLDSTGNIPQASKLKVSTENVADGQNATISIANQMTSKTVIASSHIESPDGQINTLSSGTINATEIHAANEFVSHVLSVGGLNFVKVDSDNISINAATSGTGNISFNGSSVPGSAISINIPGTANISITSKNENVTTYNLTAGTTNATITNLTAKINSFTLTNSTLNASITTANIKSATLNATLTNSKVRIVNSASITAGSLIHASVPKLNLDVTSTLTLNAADGNIHVGGEQENYVDITPARIMIEDDNHQYSELNSNSLNFYSADSYVKVANASITGKAVIEDLDVQQTATINRLYLGAGTVNSLTVQSLSGSTIAITGGLKIGSGSTMSQIKPSGATLNGNVKIVGQCEANSFNVASDMRLKEAITPYEYHDSITNLTPYTYRYKSTGKESLGFIAQDLKEWYPEIVDENPDGYLSIQESKLSYLLIEEIKQLKSRIDVLENKVKELEK